jgi:hypothetical protein
MQKLLFDFTHSFLEREQKEVPSSERKIRMGFENNLMIVFAFLEREGGSRMLRTVGLSSLEEEENPFSTLES